MILEYETIGKIYYIPSLQILVDPKAQKMLDPEKMKQYRGRMTADQLARLDSLPVIRPQDLEQPRPCEIPGVRISEGLQRCGSCLVRFFKSRSGLDRHMKNCQGGYFEPVKRDCRAHLLWGEGGDRLWVELPDNEAETEAETDSEAEAETDSEASREREPLYNEPDVMADFCGNPADIKHSEPKAFIRQQSLVAFVAAHGEDLAHCVAPRHQATSPEEPRVRMWILVTVVRSYYAVYIRKLMRLSSLWRCKLIDFQQSGAYQYSTPFQTVEDETAKRYFAEYAKYLWSIDRLLGYEWIQQVDGLREQLDTIMEFVNSHPVQLVGNEYRAAIIEAVPEQVFEAVERAAQLLLETELLGQSAFTLEPALEFQSEDGTQVYQAKFDHPMVAAFVVRTYVWNKSHFISATKMTGTLAGVRHASYFFAGVRIRGYTLADFDAYVTNYLASKASTYHSEFQYMLIYLSQVRDDETRYPINDTGGESVQVAGEKISVQRLKYELQDRLDEARELFDELSLMPFAEMKARYPLSSLRDNPQLRRNGYNFVTETLGSDWTSKLHSLLQRGHSPLQQLLFNEDGEYNEEGVHRFYTLRWEFLKLLFPILYFATGGPARGTEWGTITVIERGDAERGLYIDGTCGEPLVMLASRYNKMQARGGNEEPRMRFLGRELSELVAYYMISIYPTYVSVKKGTQDLVPNRNGTPYSSALHTLFGRDGLLLDNQTASGILKDFTSPCGAELSLLPCRHLHIHLVREYVDAMLAFTFELESEEDEYMDLQAGHTMQTANLLYAQQKTLLRGRERQFAADASRRCWVYFMRTREKQILRPKLQRKLQEENNLPQKRSLALYDVQIAVVPRTTLIKQRMRDVYGQEAEFRSDEYKWALDAILLNHRNVVYISPTGADKSAMFMVPSRADERAAVVVMCPLVSIQQNHLASAQEKGLIAYSSPVVQRGLIFLTFEYLESDDFVPYIRKLQGICSHVRIVLDEAHMMNSQATFRPAFLQINKLLDTGVQLVWLTATMSRATWRVLSRRVGLGDFVQYRENIERENLQYSLVQTEKWEDFEALSETMSKLEGKGLIFYKGRLDKLSEYVSELSVEHSIGQYSNDVNNLDEFVNGSLQWLMVSPKLSAGVDFKDVRNTIHFGPQRSLSDMVQEWGQAARTRWAGPWVNLSSAERNKHSGRCVVIYSTKYSAMLDELNNSSGVDDDLQEWKRDEMEAVTRLWTHEYPCLRNVMQEHFGEQLNTCEAMRGAMCQLCSARECARKERLRRNKAISWRRNKHAHRMFAAVRWMSRKCVACAHQKQPHDHRFCGAAVKLGRMNFPDMCAYCFLPESVCVRERTEDQCTLSFDHAAVVGSVEYLMSSGLVRRLWSTPREAWRSQTHDEIAATTVQHICGDLEILEPFGVECGELIHRSEAVKAPQASPLRSVANSRSRAQVMSVARQQIAPRKIQTARTMGRPVNPSNLAAVSIDRARPGF